MEIFQTIWTALTTENELLSNIIYLPVMLIESTVNTLLFTFLLNININRNRKISYIIFISLSLYITGLLVPNPYKALVNFSILLSSIYFFFKISILKTILCIIISTFFALLGESLFLAASNYYFNFNAMLLTNIPIYRCMIAFGIQVLVFVIYLLLKYFKIQIKFLENLSNKSKKIFLLNIILAIVSIALQFLITGFYTNKLPVYIVIFSNLSLIAYFLLSIYSLTKTTQLEQTSLILEQEKEYNKSLKSMQDELHGFRHDFSNIMCTIGGYVQVKDIEGLSKYYSQIQKDVTKINNLGALNPETINHPAVFALISSKYSKALELGIEMNINVFIDLNKLNMKIYEFTRALGILLDNAIEAAKDCDEKVINLEIRKDSSRNRQLLIIENTYNNKDVDTEKIYEKNFSTKEGNSGLGLWEVRQILKKNTNLNLFTSKSNDLFKQQLEMYNM